MFSYNYKTLLETYSLKWNEIFYENLIYELASDFYGDSYVGDIIYEDNDIS